PDPGTGLAAAHAPRPRHRSRTRLRKGLPPAGPRRRPQLDRPHPRKRAMTTTPTTTHAATAATPAARAPPSPSPGPHRSGWAQSLAKGAAGTALLHIEHARAGTGSWQTAHTWLTTATSEDLAAGPQAGLYYGAPALAYALHHANTGRPGSYQRPLTTLDTHIAAMTRHRLDQAHQRIDRGKLSTFAEW